MWLRFLTFPLLLLGGTVAVLALGAAYVIALAYPNLPSLDVLTDYQPKVPLRVYTADGALIGEFGEERRSIVTIDQVPNQLKEAILAAEDERFYEHTGIDFQGVLRAAYANLLARGRRQGASTITMQVARNFFLSSEKTLTRKLYEALLAFKIEHNLTKDQILELYINQIYLGERAYGFGAAAQRYFGKSLKDLSLAQCAVLAGLPKAPSSDNPIANPQRAKRRQLYVLGRMRALGEITPEEYEAAVKARLHTRRASQEQTFPVHAEYVAEMVRQAIQEQYPDDVYTRGFRVYTTIRKADQEAAYAAVREGLVDYDRRWGYIGPEGYVELPANATEDDFDDALDKYPDNDDWRAAVVLEASRRKATAGLRTGEIITLEGRGLQFARSALDPRLSADKRIRRGAVIRVRQYGHNSWQIGQLPEVEGSFIAVDPEDGAVRALVGGFDFGRNRFNHVTQAWRQPGSSFKPFIYSAALEKGFTPASVVPDEPIVVDEDLTGSQRWEPKNFDGRFEGPMRLRVALAKSKNMVSIRVLEAIGPKYARDYVTRFGFDPAKNPAYLTMALGAGSVTPWQMARAYAVFDNGGYLIKPYFIQKIVDDRGDVLGVASPPRAGDASLRTIDARNAFIMDSMLRDVARYGTARRAAVLGREDLAGKTGTTNEFVDAWFCGYVSSLVGIAWVGYDQPKTLGRNQTGSVVALPIWLDYMSKVIKGLPEKTRPIPDGVVTVPIRVNVPSENDPTLVTDTKMMPEYFYKENAPAPEPAPSDLQPLDQPLQVIQAPG